MYEKGWGYTGHADLIDFTVDKDIMLHGLCLFGSENNDYSVTLKINEGNNSALVSKTGTFSSTLLQYMNGKYYGFEVLFDSPVNIKTNTKHQIEALISGPSSWAGSGGISTVVCSDVTFTFQDNLTAGNCTCPSGGQLPEILFSVCR